MKRNINLFHSKQYMENSKYELYLYSDSEPLKIFPHIHDFYEIYYLLSDQVEYVVNNQVYQLKKGDFVILPPGLMHYPSNLSIHPGKTYDRIVLWCSIPCFEEFVKLDSCLNHMWEAVNVNSSYHIRPSVGSSQLLRTAFFRLLDEQENAGFATEAMTHSLLMQIFICINRIIFKRDNFQKHTPVVHLFNNIVYYIHTHLTEELSLETLSREFYVSKGYISRLFREYMGISVHQYILSLRLECSKNAIESGVPIAKAAETFGFQDYSSFFRSFKKAFLLSPKQYQDQINTPSLK